MCGSKELGGSTLATLCRCWHFLPLLGVLDSFASSMWPAPGYAVARLWVEGSGHTPQNISSGQDVAFVACGP